MMCLCYQRRLTIEEPCICLATSIFNVFRKPSAFLFPRLLEYGFIRFTSFKVRNKRYFIFGAM
jgi:hypothetical protein